MKTPYFLLFCFLSAGSLLAQTLSPEEVIATEKSLETLRSETRSFQAKVIQTLVLKELEDPVISSGIVSYARPGRLRLDFSEPAGEYLLVVPGVTIIQKTGMRPKVQRTDPLKEPKGRLDLLRAFDAPLASWRTDFIVTMKHEGGILNVSLSPKKTSHGTNKIIVRVQEQTANIISMKIELPEGYLEYLFSGHRINPPLKPSLFEWKDEYKSNNSSR